MRRNTIKYVLAVSILAKITLLVLLLPWILPPFRWVFLAIVAVPIAVQIGLLWKQAFRR